MDTKNLKTISRNLYITLEYFIFTSNISKEDFSHKISPELKSRFDYKGLFTLLYNEDKLKFIEFRLNDIIRKYKLNFENNNLPENLLDYLLSQIDVSKFNNMRDLNKKIKRMFVEYAMSQQLSEYEIIDEAKSKISRVRKILDVFNKYSQLNSKQITFYKNK